MNSYCSLVYSLPSTLQIRCNTLSAGESFGRFGEEAACFLSDLGKLAASDGCTCSPKSAFVRTVQQEIAVPGKCVCVCLFPTRAGSKCLEGFNARVGESTRRG